MYNYDKKDMTKTSKEHLYMYTCMYHLRILFLKLRNKLHALQQKGYIIMYLLDTRHILILKDDNLIYLSI